MTGFSQNTKDTSPTPAPTLGERRVRISFNPSADSAVDKIKRTIAGFIDGCEEMRGASRGANVDPEVARCISLAQTHAEDAAMWAVKAATFGK